MYPRSACNCGDTRIALFYNLYIALKVAKYNMIKKEKTGGKYSDKLDPEVIIRHNFGVGPQIDIDEKDILDALGINKECCRTIIKTNQELINYF